MKPLTYLKPSFYLLSLLFLFIESCNKEQLHTSTIAFEKNKPSIGNVRAVALSPDGDYVMAGERGTGFSSAFCLKINQFGNEVGNWPSVSSFSTLISDIISIKDEGFMLCGYYKANNVDYIYLTLLDKNLQQKPLSLSPKTGKAFQIYAHPDGSFYICGYTVASGKTKALLRKIDKNGTLIWEKENFGNGYCFGVAQNPLKPDQLMAFMNIADLVTIFYLDGNNGVTVDKKTNDQFYPGSSTSIDPRSVVVDQEGNYYFSFVNLFFAGAGSGALTNIVKWNSVDNKEIKRISLNYTNLPYMQPTTDGGIIAWGTKAEKPILVKYDALLNQVWKEEKIFETYSWMDDLTHTPDQGFFFAGSSANKSQTIFTKTGQWGNR